MKSDIIQAKRFAVAVYNIGLVGGIGYFLGASLSVTEPIQGTLLRCLGISISSTVPAIMIMVPKLLEVDEVYQWVGNLLKSARVYVSIDSGEKDSSSGAVTMEREGKEPEAANKEPEKEIHLDIPRIYSDVPRSSIGNVDRRSCDDDLIE